MRTVLNFAVLTGLLFLSACVGPAPTPCTTCDNQCVDLKTDSKNCGVCGTACAAGSVCRDGACAVTCQTNQSVCGGKCVDVKVDPANCGACGNACAAGETCQAGSCAANCPTGQSICSGACVTLDVNADNCGMCGRACPSGAVCRAGACAVQCQPAQISCDGGACINAQTENANCGACGVTCNSGEVCSNGACGTTCGGSLTTCGGDGGVRSCADTQTDNVNCGACGVTCGTGQVCTGGMCRATCGVGQNLCTQIVNLPYCANFQTEQTNCGACGVACGVGEACTNGACRTTCVIGSTLCGADGGIGGSCANTQQDNANCGACGVSCGNGETCQAGVCKTSCGTGRTLCGADAGVGGSCANTQQDNANCGACGVTCAMGTACLGGTCTTTCGGNNSLCPNSGMPICTNLQADGRNCGVCGTTCGNGESCVNGTCSAFCGAGTSQCATDAGTVCANFEFDSRNCGACGTSCAVGSACLSGACSPTITTALNLSTANLGTRTCSQGGELVRYAATALTATTATVSAAPAGGCLNVGDEVLMINLQGTATSSVNVGNYELRRVLSIAGATITFASAKTRNYGDGAADDLNLGVARTNQRVMIQRVPDLGTLFIGPGGSLTTDAWNGIGGGVLALRATTRVRNTGTIDMKGKGYDGAPATATVATTGKQGESPAGLGTVDDRNLLSGGGAGRGDLTGCPVITNGVAGGGAGHATIGSKGGTLCGGAGGATIGSSALTKIFLGAGGASGGSDSTLIDNPPGGAGGRGGGIVMLLTPLIESTGTIDISGSAGQGDAPGTNCAGGASTTSCWDFSGPGGGGAGGSFFTSATSFARRDTVHFEGGAGGDGNVANVGLGGKGSYGRVLPLPVTCGDLNASLRDGENLFAFGGDSTQPYLAYCTGVGTATPKMYLTLNNRTAAQNFSFYDPRAWNAANTVITTRWSKVRFDPLTRRISPIDYTFSTSTGSATGGPFGGTTVTRWPYGSSGDCNCGGVTGAANVDLRGLPLTLAPATVWTPQGAGPNGTATPAIDRQVMAVTGGGCCGWNEPTLPNAELEVAYLAPRATCQVIKAAIPSATDGAYTIAPDPSLPPFAAYCDMTQQGGGWTLLQDNGGGVASPGYGFYGEATPMVPGTPGYVPLAMTRLLASAAAQIYVRNTGLPATRFLTTTPNTAPIVNLRNGQLLNFSGFSNADYGGPVTLLVPNPLPFGCTPSLKGWPGVYHACNNGSGFHWLNDVAKFVNSDPAQEPLQLLVR